jgi:two-component system, OmpR family, sensor histidine kinase TctE
MKTGPAPTSIRRRLLRLLVVPVALILLAGTAGDLFIGVTPIREAYDLALSDAALALAQNVRVDAGGRVDAHVSQESLNILQTDSTDQVYFQISLPDGTLVAGDRDLPRAQEPAANPAHQTVEFRGKQVRLATYRHATRAGPVVITVAETMNKRGKVRARLLSTALWSDVLVLLAVLGLVWVGVRAAIRPLDYLSDQIARRSPSDLTPLPDTGVPLELQELVGRLNSLFATIDESGRAERQFLESAAHQLRTPLTGLLAQLDLLVADEVDADKRAHLIFIRDAAQRLSRTTQQLLALARSEHRLYTYAGNRAVDLAALAEACVSDHVERASRAGIDLGAALLPATVQGVAWLLTEALNNLLDNALTYTPAGGTITVRTGVQQGGVFLEVVDSGIGIPEAERGSVVARFHRGEHARGVGSGLGLAIVADVAQRHAATLTIAQGDNDQGTCVRLSFPT